MPWFKIDDKAHSHPKWLKAGNAAIGLFVRAGSYSAQHLTEGIVPGVIAQLYGSTAQVAKLIKVGLWHAAEHDCPRCPQPATGDYVIHDFFEGGRNTTKAQDQANRSAAAERAAKSRAARNANRIDSENDSIPPRFEEEKSANRVRNEPHFWDSTAGQEALSHRTPAEGVTHAQASKPSHYQASPTEKPASKGTGPAVPDFARDLVEQMTAAGMVVGWRLGETEWFSIHSHIKRCGTPALVEFARRRWNPADPPQTARYLTRVWSDLPDMPEPTGDGLPALRPITGPAPVSRQQQETDDMFDRAMARAIARDQQKGAS